MTQTPMLTVSMVGLALAACGDNPGTPDAGVDAPAGPPRAVIVAGDFTAGHPGVLSTLDPATRTVMPNVGPALAVGDDPILRHFGNQLFIVNRADGNNVTILDDQTLALKEQLGTGAGSNPQDVAVIGNKLYVATFGGKGLVMLTRGSTAITTIDLLAGNPSDDPDGKPNCNSVYIVGSDLYVSCELLDDTLQFFPPRGPGKVYVVNIATNTVKTTFSFLHKNPFGLFEQIPASAPHGGGELLMPTVFFDNGSGCVERVTTGATPSAPGCLVDNTDLNGYASRIAFQIDSDGALTWFAVPRTFPNADLRVYDMGIGALWSGPINPSTEAIGDVAFCPSGEVVVADTTMNANGLRVYEGQAELTTAPLAIGLPPASAHGLVCY